MQLDLTEDQALFHETTLRFVETEMPLPRTRELHEDPAGFDPKWLRKAADLGWFAMLVPEELGGGSVSGAGLLDAAIVADTTGRHVQPGPFIPMNIVASALAAHGSERLQAEVLSGLVAGDAVATWAFADAVGDIDDGAGVIARREGDGLALTGTRGFVQHAPSADHLLVVAVLDGEPVQALVPRTAAGLRFRPLECLDLSQPRRPRWTSTACGSAPRRCWAGEPPRSRPSSRSRSRWSWPTPWEPWTPSSR